MIEGEGLPDEMYSRDVAVRLLRHAAWYVGFGRRAVLEEMTITIIHCAQRAVMQMSTGDFYRIKVMGTEFYKL